MREALVACALLVWSSNLDAQTITQRGFIEGSLFVFPQITPTTQRG